MKPLIILRPHPGDRATSERAEALGLETIVVHLQQVETLDWAIPEGGFDGLLIGSANAIRHAGPKLDELRHLPVYAVGEQTAQAARNAGLVVASVGTGGLQRVLDLLAGGRPLKLLRLAGEERIELAPPPCVKIEEATLYRLADRQPEPGEILSFANPAVIALHSASATRRLKQLFDENALARDRSHLVALGPRIAEPAGEGWAGIHVAAAPDDGALLALACQICQDDETIRARDRGA